LSFLLGEHFLGEVRDTGRSSLLMQLHDKVQGYTSADDVGTPLNRALALRNVGDIELTQGRLVDAREHYALALDLLKRLPETPPLLPELARTQGRLGGTLRDQGRLGPALVEYEAATAAWRRVAGTAGSSDDCTSLADSLVALGELTNRMGRAELARQHMREALSLAVAVLLGRGGAEGECGPSLLKAEPHLNPKALAVFSHALRLRVDLLNFMNDSEAAEPLAQEVRRLNPASSSARIDSLVALSYRANSKVHDNPQVALADYRQVLEQSEEMRRWDPNNRQWQHKHAVSQVLLGSGIVACHANKPACKPMPRLEEAEAIGLEAIAALRSLAPLDKSNASIAADLRWAWGEHAKVLEKMGRHADRLLALEQAEQSYTRIPLPDPDDADTVTALAFTLQDKAKALAALNRREDAAKEMQRAIAQFTALDNAHPNHPSYAMNLAEARAVDIAPSKNGDRSASIKAAEAEVVRLRNQAEVMPQDEKDKANQRRAELQRHWDQGQALLAANDPASALVEFVAAEREARDYLHFKPGFSEGYENLLHAYSAIHSAQQELKRESERRQPLVGALYSAQMAALLGTNKQSMDRTGSKLWQSTRNLGVYLIENGALDEALPMIQEGVALSALQAQRARLESAYADYADALRAHGNAKYGLGKVRKLSHIEGWQEAVRSALIDLDKAAKINPKDRGIAQEAKDMREFLEAPIPEGSAKPAH
jgi:tetratricopeptide (TPR) repeat protein